MTEFVVKKVSNNLQSGRACIIVSRLLLDYEAVALHVVDAEHGGKVLAVHHVLHLCGHESPRLLVDDLILEIKKGRESSSIPNAILRCEQSTQNLTKGASLMTNTDLPSADATGGIP